MVAAIPLTVCTARNRPPTGARFAGLRSQSSSSWLQALRCSRLSARNSSAYCERSMESAEDALDGLEDARRLERLHDEILRAGLDRLHHQGLLAHGAAHEDLRVGIVLHDLAHRFEAGLRQDVADHRPREDGVVADEDSVAHTSSLGRQNGG